MAKAVITITDREDDPTAVDIGVNFDPELPESFDDTTMAQRVATAVIGFMQTMGDLAAYEGKDND
jgi:hypothetical protein